MPSDIASLCAACTDACKSAMDACTACMDACNKLEGAMDADAMAACKKCMADCEACSKCCEACEACCERAMKQTGDGGSEGGKGMGDMKQAQKGAEMSAANLRDIYERALRREQA